MNAEERIEKLVTDESIATLAMICGRLWQGAHGCDVKAPSEKELAEILRPTARTHILAAQREAEKETRMQCEEAVGSPPSERISLTEIETLNAAVERIRALPSVYGDPDEPT